VIHNPVVTPELFRQVREPVDHPWFAAGMPPVVLAVGRLTWEKDFPTLIRAFAAVRRQRDARLLILGEGPERDALAALVAQLGLERDVQLPGWARNPHAFMARAGVFVLSSVSEGLPTVLIEALAAAVPVVATDCVSGPREILQDGRLGPLVPPGDPDALATAIHRQLAEPRPAEAQDGWHSFSIDVATEGYLRLLSDVHA
jgi:glycosyltransferase involved in cell wall biosynthesis